MKTNRVFLSTLLVFLFISCQRQETKTYESVGELVDAMKSQVEYCSPVELKAALESNDQFYLIDVRELDEFSIACIPGAVSVPRGVLEDEIALHAPSKRTTLYIYCKNGGRSTLAATVLPKLKYTTVKVLDGGFDGWLELFPELVEVSPVRGEVKSTPAAPSGGCGG